MDDDPVLTPPGPVLLRGLDFDEVEVAWQRYERDHTDASRDELGAYYWPLVRFAVRHLALGLPSLASNWHLRPAGQAGLRAAIETYDSAREQRFETFALTQIRSSIIEMLTSSGELPHSGFWYLATVLQTLTDRLGRAPTREEWEPELDALRSGPTKVTSLPLPASTIEALDELWQASDADLERVSLLDSFPEEHAYLLHQGRSYEELSTWLMATVAETSWGPRTDERSGNQRDWIAEAMRDLHESDRLLVWLYYYENMRVLDMGGLISLASGIIPRVISGAILRLRAKLAHLPGSHW